MRNNGMVRTEKSKDDGPTLVEDYRKKIPL